MGIPVSFYGVVEGCKPKYCGWEWVTEVDSTRLRRWLLSGNQLHFKKLGLTLNSANHARLNQVWRHLSCKS